jgi:hypothetical protein
MRISVVAHRGQRDVEAEMYGSGRGVGVAMIPVRSVRGPLRGSNDGRDNFPRRSRD